MFVLRRRLSAKPNPHDQWHIHTIDRHFSSCALMNPHASSTACKPGTHLLTTAESLTNRKTCNYKSFELDYLDLSTCTFPQNPLGPRLDKQSTNTLSEPLQGLKQRIGASQYRAPVPHHESRNVGGLPSGSWEHHLRSHRLPMFRSL